MPPQPRLLTAPGCLLCLPAYAPSWPSATRCKFEHPYDKAPHVEFNSMGLPLRPGEPPCTFYLKHLRSAPAPSVGRPSAGVAGPGCCCAVENDEAMRWWLRLRLHGPT